MDHRHKSKTCLRCVQIPFMRREATCALFSGVTAFSTTFLERTIFALVCPCPPEGREESHHKHKNCIRTAGHQNLHLLSYFMWSFFWHLTLLIWRFSYEIRIVCVEMIHHDCSDSPAPPHQCCGLPLTGNQSVLCTAEIYAEPHKHKPGLLQPLSCPPRLSRREKWHCSGHFALSRISAPKKPYSRKDVHTQVQKLQLAVTSFSSRLVSKSSFQAFFRCLPDHFLGQFKQLQEMLDCDVLLIKSWIWHFCTISKRKKCECASGLHVSSPRG